MKKGFVMTRYQAFCGFYLTFEKFFASILIEHKRLGGIETSCVFVLLIRIVLFSVILVWLEGDEIRKL